MRSQNEQPLERIRRAWFSVQAALEKHHSFWRTFSACTSGERADHPGDLHDDLVALGNTAEALRRYRGLFAEAARGEEIGEREAARAVTECETHRHLVGRVMAHVAFRAVIERSMSASDFPGDALHAGAQSLAAEWTDRTLRITEAALDQRISRNEPAEEDAPEALEERERRERRQREAREAAYEQAHADAERAEYFAEKISEMFASGREGRTLLEALIDAHAGASELQPFAVLSESASQGEMEWDAFRRAVLRHVAKLREWAARRRSSA